MTITQLEYLLAVVNYGSFSLAAEKCFVTQPSLSIQIKKLEEELDLILLDRSKKPVIPTESGRLILEKSRHALKSFSQIKECAQECKGQVQGSLRLGFIPTISPYLVDKIVPIFMRKYPQINLQIYESVTADIVEKLEKDQLDAGILAEGFVPENIYEQRISQDAFYLFASPEHPLFRQEHVSMDEIDRDQLLLLTEGHCLRKQIISLCPHTQSKRASLQIECGTIETLIKLTLATQRITIIPAIALPSLQKQYSRCIKPITSDQAYRNITVAISRMFAKKGLIDILAAELKKCCSQLKADYIVV